MSLSLHGAIQAGNVAEVMIRLNMGEDINQSYPPRYCSPLHTSVLADQCEIVELLCRRGADTGLADREGVTALALAQRLGKTDMVRIISDAGGRSIPQSFPKLEVDPDPMMSEHPPWDDEDYNKYVNTQNVTCNFIQNSSKTADTDIENKLLDGKMPATGLEKIKICLSTLLKRKNKNAVSLVQENSISEKSNFHVQCEKYKTKFSNLLTRKRKEKAKKKKKKKKTYDKVWLKGMKGQPLKMYTFRAAN